MKNFILSLVAFLAFSAVCHAAPGALQQFPQAKIWNATETAKLESFVVGGTTGTKVIGYVVVEATGSSDCEIGIYRSTCPFGVAGSYSQFVASITATSERQTWYGIQSSTHGFTINHRGTRAGRVKFLWDYLDSLAVPR